MIRLACLAACLAAPACAEDLFDLPLVQPCLAAESLLTADGWVPVKLDSPRGRDIVRAAVQGLSATGRFQPAFETRAEVDAFIADASGAWLYFVELSPEIYGTFERGGIGLFVQHGLDWSDRDLLCMFAAPDIQLVADILAEEERPDGLSFTFAYATMERFGRVKDGIVVTELAAPDAARDLLTGRHSIVVEHFYDANQLPNSQD